MAKRLFGNAGVLMRLIIKRDRIRMPIWVISLCAFTFLIAQSLPSLYPTTVERQVIAETMLNPAMVAMIGKAYGIAHYTNGAMMANQSLLFTAIAVCIMNILLVVRHTRADEEDGCMELVRSLPTGRLSNLWATIVVMFGLNALLSVIIGVGLYALRIESMDLEGSLLYGATLGAIGFFFAAITAICAQVSASSRGAVGLSFAILGGAYLVRAIGDVGNEMLSWLSPLGWMLSTEVYVHNYWWPMLLTIGVTLILIGFAFYLNVIRDLGSGFLHARPGRKHASILLQNPVSLLLRLQRTTIIAWAIGMFILGASYGAVLGDIESFFDGNEMIENLLSPVAGVSLTEQFLSLLMKVIALICTIPAVMAMLKVSGEEKKSRIDHLITRSVSRTRLIGSAFVIAVVVGLVMLSLSTVGLWMAGSAVMDEPIAFGKIYYAAVVHVPAIWIMVGVAALLIGWAPKFTGVVWLYLVYSFIVVYFGGLFQLPEWLNSLTPYAHIPEVFIEDVGIMNIGILVLIVIGLFAISIAGYGKRDIQG